MSSRGGSKVFTGVISFILGFLFAIIVEVGAIFGVYWFVMSKDINTVLAAVGIDNTGDKYVNTNKDDGGVTTVKELLSSINGLVFENGELAILNKKISDIDHLIPATGLVLDKVYGMLGGYIELDEEAFENTEMTGLAQVLVDGVMYAHTAKLLTKLNVEAVTGDEANTLVKSLLMGAEAEYATVYYGEAPVAEGGATDGGTEGEGGEEPVTFKLPVFYDNYIYNEISGYSRDAEASSVGGVSNFPDNLAGKEDVFLKEIVAEKQADSESGEAQSTKTYRLYYVPCRVTDTGIEEAEYKTVEHVIPITTGDKTKNYKFTVTEFGEDTDFIAVQQGADGNYVLDYNAIYASKNTSAESTVNDRYVGYSYYEPYARNYYYENIEKDEAGSVTVCELKTYCGANYFRNNAGEIVEYDPLLLIDIMNDPFSPLDTVLVTEVVGKDNELAADVFGTTTLGALMRGEVDFDKLVDDMPLSAFVGNVHHDNQLMCNIVYKLSAMTPNGDGTYSAIYDKDGAAEQPVTVTISENGNIVDVYSEGGTKLEGAKVGSIAKLADEITIAALMDVKPDDAVMTYIGYGVTGAEEEAGTTDYTDEENVAQSLAYTHTGVCHIDQGDGTTVEKPCYISTRTAADGKVTVDKVWYVEGGKPVFVPSTSVNNISSRIDTITDYLTLPAFMDIDPEEAVVTYVGYGATGLVPVPAGTTDALGNEYAYTGTIKIDGVEKVCYAKVKPTEDGKTKITSMWYISDESGTPQKVKINGTTIAQVPDRISTLNGDLSLPDIIDIDAKEAIMAYVGYGISGIEPTASGTDSQGNACDYDGIVKIDGAEVPCFVKTETVGDQAVIKEAWYYDGSGNRVELRGTKINGLDGAISGMTVSCIFTAEEIEKNAMLKQLRHTPVSELASAIDTLLIQRIYSEEVYGIPADSGPFEAVAYDPTLAYFTLTVGEDASGKTYTYTPVGGNGTLAQADFDNRGTTVYYTYGRTDTTQEGELKIAAYRIDGSNAVSFSSAWLYYAVDDKGDLELVEKHTTGLSGTEYDDRLGTLTAKDVYDNETAGAGKIKYYTYGEARGMWRLVLYKDMDVIGGTAGTKAPHEKGYSINNFNNMVNICSHNVYNSTLGDLQKAGVIPETDSQGHALNLNKTFFGHDLSELTFAQLIELVVDNSTP